MGANTWDDLRIRIESGDGDALLQGLTWCVNGADPPKWLRDRVGRALVQYVTGGARSLDEAFGVQRPMNWRQKRAIKDTFVNIMWQEVIRLQRDGRSTTKDLFEEAAENLNKELGEAWGVHLNATDISNAYYAMKNSSEKQS